MGERANDVRPARPVLPTPSQPVARVVTGPGLSVREVLGAATLRGSEVLAGASGLDRVVERLNVMEVPDILPWVKPRELLLTTGYPLTGTEQELADLLEALDARGLAALGVKLGRYLHTLPPLVLATADRLGLPVVALPPEVGFDEILNEVLTDVLDHQAGMLVRSEEVHRDLVEVVLRGGGLGEVVERIVAILGGAVVVTTTDGRVLAEAGAVDVLVQAWNGSCFDPSGRFRTETAHNGLQGVVTGDPSPARIVVPVEAGHLDHGRIVAFAESGHLLGEVERHALERAATVCALAITQQLAVRTVEAKYRADFLRDVLAGRAGGSEEVTVHCASLGWDVGRPLVVVVAELDPSPATGPATGPALRPVHERFTGAWEGVVRARDPGAPVAGFGQQVVAVVGSPVGEEALHRLVNALVGAVRGDGGGGRRSFTAGVSRVVAGPAGIPAAYAQAVTTVRVGRAMHGPGACEHFDRLGVFRVLSLVEDQRELMSFVSETLRTLAVRDDAESADLRHTLEVLLDCNLNVAEAARALHFHYNTLRYRIAKLERLLGPFTQDAHLRLNLALALQVLRMRGVEQP